MSPPSQESRAKYLRLLQAHPALCANPAGRIFRILTDRDDLDAAEKAQGIKLATKLLPQEWANVGIVYEDQYVMILRDAVEFPDGSRGTYIRILGNRPGAMGVAVLPILGDKILLIRHFRHATRNFHLEIPRGFTGDDTETCETAGIRELREEIGVTPLTITSLGVMYTDTGLNGGYVCLLAATIAELGNLDLVESISQPQLLSMEELSDLLRGDQITDSFTLCAILLAHQKGIEPLTKLMSSE